MMGTVHNCIETKKHAAVDVERRHFRNVFITVLLLYLWVRKVSPLSMSMGACVGSYIHMNAHEKHENRKSIISSVLFHFTFDGA